MTDTNRHASKTDDQLAYDLKWANREHAKHSCWEAIAETWANVEKLEDTRLAVQDMGAYHAMMVEYYEADIHALTAEQGRRELAALEAAAGGLLDVLMDDAPTGLDETLEDAMDNATESYQPRNTQRRHDEERRRPPAVRLAGYVPPSPR